MDRPFILDPAGTWEKRLARLGRRVGQHIDDLVLDAGIAWRRLVRRIRNLARESL